jgi:tetratricopeptide (TPR) repeat protein
MYQFPKKPKKIRQRIRRYEREMRKEYERFGFIDDGYGKRYLLGPLYLILGDLPGAIATFEWFARMFPDDMGDPFHYLCWALALYRSGDIAGASAKLHQAMLSNLYLIPHLLGIAQETLDIWHDSNLAEKDYTLGAPPEIWALWDEPALAWARETYERPAFCRVRARYIEIYRQLQSEPPGPKRSHLVDEAMALLATGEASG